LASAAFQEFFNRLARISAVGHPASKDSKQEESSTMQTTAAGQGYQTQQYQRAQWQQPQAQVAEFAPSYESSYQPSSSGANQPNAKNFFQQHQTKLVGGGIGGGLGLISVASSGPFSFATGAAAGAGLGLSIAMKTHASKQHAAIYAGAGALGMGLLGAATHGFLPALITIAGGAYAGQDLATQYQSGSLQQFFKS
jgi:hypothetical protein